MDAITPTPTLSDLAPKAPAAARIKLVAPGYYDRNPSWADVNLGWDGNKQAKVLRCRVPLGHGYDIVAYSAAGRPGKVYVDAIARHTDQWGYERDRNAYWRVEHGEVVDVDPFVSAEVLGTAYTKVVTIDDPNWHSYRSVGNQRRTKEVVASYGKSQHWDGSRHTTIPGVPYQHLKLRVAMLDGSGEAEVELRFERPESGTLVVARGNPEAGVTLDFFGTKLAWNVNLSLYPAFRSALTNYELPQGREALWAWWLDVREVNPDKRDVAGVKAIETRKDFKPVLERVAQEEPLLWQFFAFLHDGRTREKTTNNKLIAAMLEKVGPDFDKLVAELRRARDEAHTTEHVTEYAVEREHLGELARPICLSLTGAGDKVAEDKAKQQWQFAKGARAQAEVLGISPDRHPRLLARVEAGDISLNLFHEAGDENSLINVEFDLIERAFAREGWEEVLVEIMANASARTTYSKRVTSYLAFLFRIERYLDRHAPRPDGSKWKAMPRFVQSQWELEMDEATEEGTTKRRSAFTPVADNEAGTITVPYVAMAISGVRTTWCYSETYFVAEEGAEDPVFEAGGVFENELAEKLNGRDDYGLCLFTLTGTDQNTGYPTFLVIFERTTKHGTRVHFHRVHPSRKRGPGGTQTPPNRLIEECYRYMAGNVRAEQILHQQGDILLLPATGPGKSVDAPAGVLVRGFENHAFVATEHDGVTLPVRLVRSQAKARDNLLGWLHAPTGMRMPHPEHEPVEGIAPGWYEVRRCKSWEANPTAVWSLNID